MLTVDPQQNCNDCEPIKWMHLWFNRALVWLNTYNECHHLGNCTWCISEIEAVRASINYSLMKKENDSSKD